MNSLETVKEEVEKVIEENTPDDVRVADEFTYLRVGYNHNDKPTLFINEEQDFHKYLEVVIKEDRNNESFRMSFKDMDEEPALGEIKGITLQYLSNHFNRK